MSSSKYLKLARPVIMGLVGGIASGKSFVGKLLEQHGALRIDADGLGHEVLREPVVRKRLGELWGKSVLNDDGEVDRKAIAALVFGDSVEAVSRRRLLEQIVHPRIRNLAEQQIAAARAEPNPLTAIVIDAPLLLEAGWERLCDLILFVDAPQEIRVARARNRGWTKEQFEDREANQLSLSEKRSRATHIIDNSIETNLGRQIDRLWNEISKRIA